MFRLTREVRFAINGADDPQLRARPTNGYGGYPSLCGIGPYLELAVTLSGPLDPASSYLINIRQIDATVREVAVPQVIAAATGPVPIPPARLVGRLYQGLQAWPPMVLERLTLKPSPFLEWSALASEVPLIRLSQKFEFSASHRLHNPQLGAEENRRLFGKCNNPHGHGHNYELQVTLVGEPDDTGAIVSLTEFESRVAQTVIDRFDHRNLNVELPEFRELNPTVENIAMTIYRLLKPQFQGGRARLAAVTVWETPKTWCEYSEE